MSWLTNKKEKIINKLKSNYAKTHHNFLQMQIPLTKTQRLEHWIKLGLWSILTIIFFLLINLSFFTLAGLYSTVMVLLFWLKGWDPIAHKLAQYWQEILLERMPRDPKLITLSNSVIAEQRILDISAIIKDWQLLSSEDHSLKALRVLDTIYRVAVGAPVATTDIVELSTILATDRSETPPTEV